MDRKQRELRESLSLKRVATRFLQEVTGVAVHNLFDFDELYAVLPMAVAALTGKDVSGLKSATFNAQKLANVSSFEYKIRSLKLISF
jgi:hypothetical protein